MLSEEGERVALLPGLLDHAVRRRHDVLVHPEAEAQWNVWLEHRDAVLRDVYRRAERDSQSRQGRAPSDVEVWVVDETTSDWKAMPPRLCLRDVIEVLGIPLEVLVEDETSDGAFLDAAVPPPLRSAWMAARRARRVGFVSLGGVGQVKRRLEGERGRVPRSMRTMVLVDSDAPRPWLDPHEPPERSWKHLPEENRGAARAAASRRIPVHVLERRMAENYIPPPTVLAWAKSLSSTERKLKLPHAEHLQRLPPECRRHHHLKKGIRQGERANYGELTAEAEAALTTSLGSSAWEAFSLASEVDLREDGVHTELIPLFRRILGTL